MVLSPERLFRISNGHPLMVRVTGMGCTATAITGAFAAVHPSPVQAAAHAMAVMGIAGEMASLKAAGPGSFQMHFLDALHAMREEDIRQRLKMRDG
jgi:hydroxyethylthiazole kinase